MSPAVPQNTIEAALNRREANVLAQLDARYSSCCSALEAHAISEVRFAESLGSLHADADTESKAVMARATAKRVASGE
jgi:hypothetical protein